MLQHQGPRLGKSGRSELTLVRWSLSYVHRPPGTKVDYEKEIKRVATFGSVSKNVGTANIRTDLDRID